MSTRTVILVIGMRDNDSRERVLRALEAVEGVEEVDVNLFRARASVIHSVQCDGPALARAIDDAGFEARLTPGRSGGACNGKEPRP